MQTTARYFIISGISPLHAEYRDHAIRDILGTWNFRTIASDWFRRTIVVQRVQGYGDPDDFATTVNRDRARELGAKVTVRHEVPII